MTNLRLSRRHLLLRGGTILGAALIGGLSIKQLRHRRRLLIDALVAPYLDNAAARRLGAEYLKHETGESSQRQLIAALLPISSGLTHQSRDAILPTVKQRIVDDWAANETVTLRHWQLSRTEARLYALAALRSRKAT